MIDLDPLRSMAAGVEAEAVVQLPVTGRWLQQLLAELETARAAQARAGKPFGLHGERL